MMHNEGRDGRYLANNCKGLREVLINLTPRSDLAVGRYRTWMTGSTRTALISFQGVF